MLYPPIICEISDSFANMGVEWSARLWHYDAKRDGLALHWISAAAATRLRKPFALERLQRGDRRRVRHAELIHQSGCAGQRLTSLELSVEDVRLKHFEDFSLLVLRQSLFLPLPHIIP